MIKWRIVLFIVLTQVHFMVGQPFRYKQLNGSERDSVKKYKIKGYTEYLQEGEKTNKKSLVAIVTYDQNGNLTRHWKLDIATNKQNQWTLKYSSKNELLEDASYFPDSLTLNQRFIFQYDENGNQISKISENYHEGKLVQSTKQTSKFNKQGKCTDDWWYDEKGTLTHHFEYKYNAQGKKIQSIEHDIKSDTKRKIDYNPFEQDDKTFLPSKFPMGHQSSKKGNQNNSTKKTYEEKTIYNNDGTKTVDEEFYSRTYNKNNILLKYEMKNVKTHWYDYTYYH